MLLSITPYNLDGTPDMFVITVANYTSNITSFSTGLFLVLYVLVWRHLLAYDEWLPTSLLLWFLSSRIRLFSFWYLSSENLSVFCILTFRIYSPYFWTNRIALFLSTKWSLHCPFGWVATSPKEQSFHGGSLLSQRSHGPPVLYQLSTVLCAWVCILNRNL